MLPLEHLHGAIHASASEPFAIGGPRYRCYWAGVAGVLGKEIVSGAGIPHLHGAIPACGSEPLAIGGPRY